MAAPVISISSDVSVESVGSSFPRVVLIGSISIEVSVTPKVGAAAVASPAGVLELDTHSSLEADPSKKSDTEIPEWHVSPTTSTPEIPTAPILPAPSAIVALSSEALTVRKSVRPLPSHHLALRYTSHHFDHFTSGSSLSHSSSDHSTFGHSISGHSLPGHTPPDTTDADSSTPPRFVHPSLARTLRCSEAYLRWRSLAAIVTSHIHDTRALVTSHVDLLPPCKRFRDSISPEDSVEEDNDTDVLEDIEAEATVVKVAKDRDVEARIDTGIGMEVDVGVDVEDEVKDEVESSDKGTMEVRVDVVAGIDIPDEIPLQRIEDIEKGQRELESRSLTAGGERASLLEQVASLERSNVRLRGIMMMKRARADRFRRRVRFMKSELRQICRFRYYDRMRFRRLETFAVWRLVLAAYEATRAANALKAEVKAKTAATTIMEMVGMEMVEMEMVRMEMGTERVVGLIRWFEKMEIVFYISNCTKKYQVKYATCTLLNSALTWWNSHKRTIGAEAAFSMSWRELMKLMAEVYCPRNEIQKMESELWNLTVKNNDLAA
ncbi:reverse transcriptase domain-containing protein [Tanacetum coccineum]